MTNTYIKWRNLGDSCLLLVFFNHIVKTNDFYVFNKNL